MKLEPEFKKKWIEALRSGKFKQATGVLYRPQTDDYCCIGVAGVLCGIPSRHMNNHPGDLLSSLSMAQYNVPEVLKNSESTVIQQALAEMNDKGKSFNEIADYIEENL